MSDLSFLAPARLALLLVPLALLAGYLTLQVRRRRYALRFTNLDLLDEVAPDRPGWRRHLPAVLLLAGLALATLAVARPAVATEVADEQAIVILAIDTSLSMQATDVSPSRVEAAKEAAGSFLDSVPDGVAVGVVGFDSDARQLIAPTDNLDAVRRTIDRAALGEGTAIGEAVFTSLDAIADAEEQRAEDDRPAARASSEDDEPVGTIVLLSDGENTEGRSNDEAARAAKAQGIAVNTIAFGTNDGVVQAPTGEQVPVPVNRAALQELADDTGGRYFPAATAEELRQVYENLGRGVERQIDQREIADWFAAGALALLSLAGVGSLLWFGRLP